MDKLERARPWILTILIACGYHLVVATIWAFLPLVNPVTNWLFERYAQAAPNLHITLVWIHDFIVNILIALPFAALVARIRPDRRWTYVAVAVLVIFLWQYRVVLFDFGLIEFVRVDTTAWLGMVLTFIYLPLALFIASMPRSQQ